MPRGTSASQHLARIKALPCAVCGQAGPSDAHHIRAGQGMAQRASDWLTVPCCRMCHTGPNGIHGDRALWKIYRLDELGALAATIERLCQ